MKDWAIKSKDWWFKCGRGWNKECLLLSQLVILEFGREHVYFGREGFGKKVIFQDLEGKDLSIVHAWFTHYSQDSQSLYLKKIFKMGLMTLFTHFNIILQ